MPKLTREGNNRSDTRRQYHLQLEVGDAGGYVLLPGDPGRCELIARHLVDPRHVVSNREFTTYTGSLDGAAVSVTSTGIGGPSTAIAAEELINLGAHTLIRVGSCGAIASDLEFGDLVVVGAAVRHEGTSDQYVPAAFPAVADLDVLCALRDAARERGGRFRVGIAVSSDAFYPEIDASSSPVEAELRARWDAWARAGCLAAEMESATLFVVASVRRVRAGAVLAVVDAAGSGAAALPDARALPMEPAITVAVAALRRLIALDAASGTAPGG